MKNYSKRVVSSAVYDGEYRRISQTMDLEITYRVMLGKHGWLLVGQGWPEWQENEHRLVMAHPEECAVYLLPFSASPEIWLLGHSEGPARGIIAQHMDVFGDKMLAFKARVDSMGPMPEKEVTT